MLIITHSAKTKKQNQAQKFTLESDLQKEKQKNKK